MRSDERELILVTAFEPARVTQASIGRHVGRMAISVNSQSAFNRLGQYASSPGNRVYVYCHSELAVFFSSGGRTIASTHFAYPRRDGQAELAWVFD